MWASAFATRSTGTAPHARSSTGACAGRDRRRGAGQLAAVEDEVGAGADRLRSTSSRRFASAPPARFALDCRTASATPTQRARTGTRRPSVLGSGPQASGKRRAGFGSSSVTPGEQAPRPRGCARRGRAAPRARSGGEEHHRRRLLRRAPLERVEALRRRGHVVGVAREPVDRVGREHRHAARPRRSARARLAGASPPPHHHALDPRQVAERSHLAEAAARASASTASRLALAVLEREEAGAGRSAAGTSRRITRARRRPRTARASAPAPTTSRHQRVARRDVGRVRDDGIEPRPQPAGRPRTKRHVEPEPRGVRARDVERVGADVGRDARRGPAAPA